MHGPRRLAPPSHRKLSGAEEETLVDMLHSERLQDQTPRQVHAELLEEGTYLASPTTMYRVLAARGESQERRDQRDARSHAVLRLEATAPNQVWTWDISKFATYVPGAFLNLYLVLDLFSRYPVAARQSHPRTTTSSRGKLHGSSSSLSPQWLRGSCT